MANNNGREIELINDRDLARKRLSIFAGMDRRATIVCKETFDNTIDVVGESSQRANKAVIRISPNHLFVMDNGDGISVEKKEGTEFTHLWLACAKMFSSSNYNGVAESVGANGVGMTITNYTAKTFSTFVVKKEYSRGYTFFDGFLTGTSECCRNANNYDLDGKEQFFALNNGDFVSNPLSTSQLKERFDLPFDTGFLVDVVWFKRPNELFQDDTDIAWLRDYAKNRVGELKAGEITFEIYEDDDFTTLKSSEVWSKNKNSENYVKSWIEKVKEAGAMIKREGPWTFAFSTNSMNIQSIVQGAPVRVKEAISQRITIGEYAATVSVPFTLNYLSTDYPPYQDQTKTEIRLPYTSISRAFTSSGEVYGYFYKQAEKACVSQAIKDSESNTAWPALGPAENAELIIAEGYSAISGLKSQRNPTTQACIALRGKISNCWNLDMARAMRSDIVRQILNEVLNKPYKRIIIATDEDTDGHHIAALILALFARFTHLIEDEKVFRVHSPLFLFKKRGAVTLFSDKESDKPEGYVSHRNKGLGSLTAEEVSRFIMNQDQRELIAIKWDDNAYESLDLAFSRGGKDWVDIEGTGKTVDENEFWNKVYTKGEMTISEFIHTKYREFWEYSNKNGKNSVDPREQIPEVVRKIIYASYKLGIKPHEEHKTTELSGEVGKYHGHGPTPIEDSIKGVATPYKSQPAVRLLEGVGNFGTAPGDEGAAARYTSISGTPLMSAIYKDIPFMPFSTVDTGLPQPDYISCPLPMNLINGLSAIGTGFSCYIAERDAREVVEWIDNLRKHEWDDNFCPPPKPMSVTGCQTWLNEDNGYVYYKANVQEYVSVPGRPGKYDVITELPPKSTPDSVLSNLRKKLPQRAIKNIIDGSGKDHPTYILVPHGFLNDEDFAKYGLISARKETVLIWEESERTMILGSIVRIAKEWFEDRCRVVTMRLNKQLELLRESNHKIDLIRQFAENGMINWSSDKVVKFFTDQDPENGEKDANIVLNQTARTFLPENLDKNKLTRTKNDKAIVDLEHDVEFVGDVVIKEAFDIIDAQERFFA